MILIILIIITIILIINNNNHVDGKSDSIVNNLPLIIPKYCIDSYSIEIFNKRLSCLSNVYSNDKTLLANPLIKEFQLLRNSNASEYTRSHELLAHLYYIDSNNPYRVTNCIDAEMEYIPLLPLDWKMGQNLQLQSHCSYSAFIQDILAYMKHIKTRPIYSIPRFAVASTFNMRTAMGTGMPTQIRRGEAWNTVSEFVMSVYIGHYERWPQCPDLLRKSWKHVIELPYIPLTSIFNINEKNPTSSSSILLPQSMNDKTTLAFVSTILNDKKKRITFSFTGRKLLWGPERICSVRTAINSIREKCISSSSSSSLYKSLNVTIEKSYTKVDDDILDITKRSTFCIIGKADSYSTSSFYTALHSLCIPIVISDWYVFAFPSFIPWETFVIRIDEETFQKCPECSLQKIMEYYQQNPTKLDDMFSALLKWIGLISYEQVPYNSLWRSSQQSLYHVNGHNNDNGNSNMVTVIPFELMMLEIKFVHNMFINSTTSLTSSLPSFKFTKCESPHFCSSNKGWQVRSFFDLHKYVIPDERSNLCKRVGGLIGHYKIVYFMQCVRILWPLQPGKMIKQDLVPALPLVPSIRKNNDCSIKNTGIDRYIISNCNYH